MTEKAQFDAILHGAAFAPITDRAFLRITGPDATRWLNGMVTNNIKDLAPGQGNYNFLLNNQGRIMGDCTIYREPDAAEPVFLLETDSAQIDTIQQLLDKFIIMDDVELAPHLTNAWGLFLLGTDPSWVRHLAIDKPRENALMSGRLDGHPVLILTKSSKIMELWFTTATPKDETLQSMKSEGIMLVSPETLEAYRIYSGTPRYGIDIRNTETAKDLPQETAQTHALHFSKGCYLGQEIVERIHSRGQVHRTFAQFTLAGSLPTLPAVLEANGKTVGELTSVANINDTIIALGYARREALDTNQPLTYPGGTALRLESRIS
jgi:folate-binding protein YgfZ